MRAGGFALRGVRSPAARKHLAAMRLGDPVLFYRSQESQAIIGLMEVCWESYSDPTSADARWLTCDFTPLRTFSRPIALAELRSAPPLAAFRLLTQPRLAVVPVTQVEYEWILDRDSATSRLDRQRGSTPPDSREGDPHSRRHQNTRSGTRGNDLPA